MRFCGFVALGEAGCFALGVAGCAAFGEAGSGCFALCVALCVTLGVTNELADGVSYIELNDQSLSFVS
jgi:hypothetical protein